MLNVGQIFENLTNCVPNYSTQNVCQNVCQLFENKTKFDNLTNHIMFLFISICSTFRIRRKIPNSMFASSFVSVLPNPFFAGQGRRRWLRKYVQQHLEGEVRQALARACQPHAADGPEQAPPDRAGCCIARDRANLTGLVLGCIEAKFCK